MTAIVQVTCWIVAGLGMAVSLAWIWLLAAMLHRRKLSNWLMNLPDSPPLSGWPRLTVIFAARDEAADVEPATRSLLAQDYPDLEVVAVDDRSSDDTGTILDGLAAENAALRVVHIRDLPPGWLGKTHALNIAAEAASSPWLLFTDADVVFAPGALRRAVAWADTTGLDHLTVVPEFSTYSIGERLFMTIFSLSFATRVILHRGHLGIGAFNLVRAAAFRRIGGFDHLRLSVDDDNRLAQALKAAGGRAAAIFGAGAVSVRWQTGLCGLIRGMEKNYFAILDYRLPMVVAACGMWLVLGTAPHAGLLIGPWWTRLVCGAGLAAFAILLGSVSRHTGIAWYYAAALPLCVAANLAAMVRSIWLTLWRGGVLWRGCRYPLADLREHVEQRNAWLHELRHAANQPS